MGQAWRKWGTQPAGTGPDEPGLKACNRTVKVDMGTPTYYTYNVAKQMLTETTGAETTYYHYDGCGNTTAKQEPAGTTYYQYNTENLMTRIDFPDDTHSYYTYDADSKRVSQRTAEGYSEFIYQGPDMGRTFGSTRLQMERDEDGDTKVQYTMGAGLEAMRRDGGGGMASGDSSFYHYNHLGTTIALTDSDEAATDTYRHDAWGVLLASTGSTVNPHTYVGQQRYYRMPNASLYHLSLRSYSARTAGFMQLDPLTASLGYAYVRNQPTTAYDPTGQIGLYPITNPDWVMDLIRAIQEHVMPKVCEALKGAHDRTDAWEGSGKCWDCLATVVGIVEVPPTLPVLGHAVDLLDCAGQIEGLCRASPGQFPISKVITVLDCFTVLDAASQSFAYVDLFAAIAQEVEQGGPTVKGIFCACPYCTGPLLDRALASISGAAGAASDALTGWIWEHMDPEHRKIFDWREWARKFSSGRIAW